jgi:hypothetical protein
MNVLYSPEIMASVRADTSQSIIWNPYLGRLDIAALLLQVARQEHSTLGLSPKCLFCVRPKAADGQGDETDETMRYISATPGSTTWNDGIVRNKVKLWYVSYIL